MDQLIPNSTTALLPAKPTSEYISSLISELENLDGLTGQAVSGIPPLDCIRFLFDYIRLQTEGERVYELEYQFLHAVASALLNSRRTESGPKLHPSAGQVRSIRRVVFHHGDTILVAWTGPGPGPEAIDKTIIFIHSLKKVVAARYDLLSGVIKPGLSPARAERLIQRYDVDTRPNDQQRILDDFVEENSPCQILLTAVARRKFMDIRNVKRVIQFGPIGSGDLADLLQRFGQAVWDGQTQGKAFFFPPYWYLDLVGTNANLELPKPKRGRGRPRKNPRKYPHVIGADDETSNSSAHSWEYFALTDESSAASIACGNDDPGLAIDTELGQFGAVIPAEWTKSELKSREALMETYPDIYIFVHASCFRKYALEFLQEPTGDGVEGQTAVPPTVCCNGCYHELGRLPRLPPKPPIEAAPRKGTMQWFAWQELQEFCAEQAEKLVAGLDCLFKMPASLFMPNKIQWKVAGVFDGTANAGNITQLVEDILLESDWDERERFSVLICAEAVNIYQNASTKHRQYLDAQKQDKGVGKVQPKTDPLV
ncbi:hypothetical protein F4804DRAFT_247402 [Jackrogersella minutella]|nr:hypothetical protein F4804DRAFT_247402 [Jackrogersella minutella]